MIDLGRVKGTLFIVASCHCAWRSASSRWGNRPWWPMSFKNDWATWQLECHKRVGPQISELIRDGLPSDRRVRAPARIVVSGRMNPTARTTSVSTAPLATAQRVGASMCELEETMRWYSGPDQAGDRGCSDGTRSDGTPK